MESAGKRQDIPRGRTGHDEKTGHYNGKGMGYVIFCGRFYGGLRKNEYICEDDGKGSIVTSLEGKFHLR